MKHSSPPLKYIHEPLPKSVTFPHAIGNDFEGKIREVARRHTMRIVENSPAIESEIDTPIHAPQKIDPAVATAIGAAICLYNALKKAILGQ